MTREIGQIDLCIRRARRATFESVTVPEHQRRLDGLSVQVSRETISKIADQIADEPSPGKAARHSLYAVLLIDCMVIRIHGSQIPNWPVYVAIGVNHVDDERDVLGLWLGPTGGEGAKWATMQTELRTVAAFESRVLLSCSVYRTSDLTP